MILKKNNLQAYLYRKIFFHSITAEKKLAEVQWTEEKFVKREKNAYTGPAKKNFQLQWGFKNIHAYTKSSSSPYPLKSQIGGYANRIIYSNKLFSDLKKRTKYIEKLSRIHRFINTRVKLLPRITALRTYFFDDV